MCAGLQVQRLAQLPFSVPCLPPAFFFLMRWVFTAAHELSLVAANRASVVRRLLIAVASLVEHSL